MDLSYILNSLGEEDHGSFKSTAPPLVQSTNFDYSTLAEMKEALAHEDSIPFYTRGVNPTTRILAQKMAALEKTEDALIFASGSAAIAAAILGNVEKGDHIVCVQKPYSWTRKLLTDFLPRFGVETTFVDGSDSKNFQQAIIDSTRVIFLESPNSWTYEMQDIEDVTRIARGKNLLTIMDNSYASPLGTNPVDYGVDIVVHAATKYIGGHGDAVAGILCGSKAMVKKIFRSELMTLGGIASPFNSWLLLRGLRTLELRLERSSQTAASLVEYLEKHPAIEKVFYPMSPQSPQYALAQKYLKLGTGLFTIDLVSKEPDRIEAFCNQLKNFKMACSWGGFESLIFPALALMGSQNYDGPDIPVNRSRVYVGLEGVEVLRNDLDTALSYAFE